MSDIAERMSTWDLPPKHGLFDDENDNSLMQKKHLLSLSYGCYAYGRDGDPDDTLVVRDLSSEDDFIVFGLKGLKRIRDLHYALWDMIACNKSLLKPLDTSLDYVYQRYSVYPMTESWNCIEMTVTDINVDITLFKDEASFGLFNMKNGQVDCGVVLDLPDIIKLCRYLHQRFEYCNFFEWKRATKYINDTFF